MYRPFPYNALPQAHKLDIDAGKLKNGPVMKRSCTDIICCLLFLAFIVGFAGTSAYGFMNGDPYLLLTAWDNDGKYKLNLILSIGNGCGYNETTKDYPLLYWPAPDVSAISDVPLEAFKYSTCVKECPTNESEVLCKEPSFFTTEDKFSDC